MVKNKTDRECYSKKYINRSFRYDGEDELKCYNGGKGCEYSGEVELGATWAFFKIRRYDSTCKVLVQFIQIWRISTLFNCFFFESR